MTLARSSNKPGRRSKKTTVPLVPVIGSQRRWMPIDQWFNSTGNSHAARVLDYGREGESVTAGRAFDRY